MDATQENKTETEKKTENTRDKYEESFWDAGDNWNTQSVEPDDNQNTKRGRHRVSATCSVKKDGQPKEQISLERSNRVLFSRAENKTSKLVGVEAARSPMLELSDVIT